MNQNTYTQRDYAEDDPDSVQSGSVTEAVTKREVGQTHSMSDVEWDEEGPQGHANDAEALEGYCDGSRSVREKGDTADQLAKKFEGY